MKIETKYNIGDTLYCLRNNEVFVEKIESIHIYGENITKYSCQWNKNVTEDTIDKRDIFTSKEKLLASLCNYYGTNKERTL